MVWARVPARAGVALLALGLALALFAWLAVDFASASMIHATPDDLAPAEAGLVLGTSPRLPSGQPNPYFEARIEAAAQLYRSGKVEYLIVSGNQSRGGRPAGGYDEPNAMRDALIAAGVPAERIYRDYAGFRTLDSVLRAASVFGQERVIVVSQRFHLSRALFLARRHGLAFEGFVAADPSWRFGDWTQLREAGARVRAIADATFGVGSRFGGVPIALGVDPPS